MKKTKRNYLIIALIVILLALSVGYAAFSAVLNIEGTATGTAGWDVHFKEGKFLQADGSSEDTTHSGETSLSTTTTTNDTMTVSVNLAYPGDGVLLEAVVENSGNLPAKLTGFEITNNNEDLIVEQANEGPKENEKLAANGGTCTAKFVIKWDPESTAEKLDNNTFSIKYTYEQDTTEFTGTATHEDSAQ